LSSYLALLLGADHGGAFLGFGISGFSLVFLQFGAKMPVTHHISLVAAGAAIASGSLVWGALFGIGAAFVAQFWACTFTIHADTYIDPPAVAIFSMWSVMVALGALGVYNLIPCRKQLTNKGSERMESFTEFRMSQVFFYGRDSFSTIGEQTALRGSKALIISDHIMEKLGVLSRCQKHLEQSEVAYTAYLNVDTEPSDIHVAESLDLFLREKCDVIVAVGGGSCIDTAKAVAVLASNGGYIGDYVGMKAPIKKDPVKLIVAPTTAGTGSEVTSVTVINNTKDDVKMMIRTCLMPSVAIVDPVLTLSLPPHVTAATGIDALCHAVEGYISRLAQPLTDILALSAIKLIWENLKKAYTNGNDIDARENMSLPPPGGDAFSNSSVCGHALSARSARCSLCHGVSNAMLLPGVLVFTKGHALKGLL
jgi:alcohol dehydrogenase class IV